MSIGKLVGVLVALAALALLLVPGQADAGKGGAGVKGVVLSSTCPGPCVEPQHQAQPYAGEVSVVVVRVRDGRQFASEKTTDGRFRIRVKRGRYDVSAVSPGPTCGPNEFCPAQSSAAIAPCLTGDTQRVRVHRHRFTRVELHVQNVCVA